MQYHSYNYIIRFIFIYIFFFEKVNFIERAENDPINTTTQHSNRNRTKQRNNDQTHQQNTTTKEGNKTQQTEPSLSCPKPPGPNHSKHPTRQEGYYKVYI